MRTRGKYKLEGRELVEVLDLFEWAEWIEDADRSVGESEIGDVRVSTVFLGLDMNIGWPGPPQLFESMIFGGKHDRERHRYATYAEALDGHNGLVDRERADQGVMRKLWSGQ